MRKALFEGLAMVLAMALLFFLFNAMDLTGFFKVKERGQDLEEKLGNLLRKTLAHEYMEMSDPEVRAVVDTIMHRLCRHNAFDPKDYKVFVVSKDEANAFALPGGQIVVYSGLISISSTPEELAGVMAHEMAHINHRHVMKKLVREVGLSVLVSASTGSAGGEVAKSTLRSLSSSAFDRTMEKEADLTAVAYMSNAGIDPEHLANFLTGLSLDGGSYSEYLAWISTHPESGERANYILEAAEIYTVAYLPVLIQPDAWEACRNALVVEAAL